MRKITVIVSEEGDITVDMDGFHGETCVGELNRLVAVLDNLGVRVKSRSDRRKSGVSSVSAKQGVTG